MIINIKMKKIFLILIYLIFPCSVLADSKMELGLDIYNNKGMCSSCHTLKAAESVGKLGPNLDQLKPQLPQIVMAVTNGVGVMPAWDGILSSEEILRACSSFSPNGATAVINQPAMEPPPVLGADLRGLRAPEGLPILKSMLRR